MNGHPDALGGALLALGAALVLVAVNAMFVAAEFALVRVRPGRLKALARQGHRRAALGLVLVQRLNESLSVCQVGITLCNLGLGFLGEPAFARLIGWVLVRGVEPVAPWVGPLALTLSIGASFLVMTVLLVVLGELVPKQIAISIAERVTLATAIPLRVFWYGCWPLVAFFNGSARLLLARTRFAKAPERSPHTLEEIRQVLALSAKGGQISAWEVNLLENLLRFGKGRARDAMVPRASVVALDARQPVEALLARAQAEGYSRYPLVEGDLDHVIGTLHVKDLHVSSGRGAPPDLRRLARPPLIVPDALPLERLLRRFQQERAHLAVVANEYGATVGIVTLEDVLEELVGELRDEFDAEEPDQIRAAPGGAWVLDPALPLARALDLAPEAPAPPEGVHTLAGFLQAQLGRLPRQGDRIPFGARYDLVAAVVQGTRILRVELVPRG